MPHNLVWITFSATEGHPGQVKRYSLPLQVEAALKYLVVPLTFAHDCTMYIQTYFLYFRYMLMGTWVVGTIIYDDRSSETDDELITARTDDDLISF